MEIRFDDYNAYPDTDILEVTEAGIQLSTGQFISYDECAANFSRLYGGSGKCVGERNISELSVTCYTAPLTTHIVFTDGNWFQKLFRRESAVEKFRTFCTLLADAGYTTMDES